VKRLLLAFSFVVVASARADLFVGDLATQKCKAQKTKLTVLDYVRKALGDKKVEVTHDREGHCGEGAYVMRVADRKRWAVFGSKEHCECYLRASSLLDKGK
jgi:hypothetical protein